MIRVPLGNGSWREMEPYSAIAYAVSAIIPLARVLLGASETTPLPGKTFREATRIFIREHCRPDDIRALRVVRDVLVASIPQEPAA